MEPTQEQWRPVVGYEGAYEVSNQGRVRSLDRVVPLKNGRKRRAPGRMLKLIPRDRERYVAVSLFDKNRGRTALVHHIVLEAFVGLRPEGLACCHNDGSGLNNHVDNLRWDTYSENNFDLVRHGVHFHANKTHCPQEHEYTPENTRMYLYHGTWRRYCRECRRIHNRARKARLRDAAHLAKSPTFVGEC